MKTIERDELLALQQSGAWPTVLETLSEDEFQRGHLPGAKHFPFDRVSEGLAELAPIRESLVVTYCASESCGSSHIVARWMEDMGYLDVRVYVGGKKDWSEAGLPLER